MASWIKDKYDPEHLASRMEATRSVNEKGQASFTGWEHREHIVLLDSMTNFQDGIPDFEKHRIINKAVFSAGSKGVITPKRLLSEISRLEAEFLRRPTKKYYLITSISIEPTSPLKRYVLNRCTIVFKPSLPNAFIKSRDRLIESRGRGRVCTAHQNLKSHSPTVFFISSKLSDLCFSMPQSQSQSWL
jgi:hypothetical protein